MEIIEIGPVPRVNGGTYTSGVCIVVQNLIDVASLYNLPVNAFRYRDSHKRIARASVFRVLLLAIKRLSAVFRLVNTYGIKRAVNLLSIAASVSRYDGDEIIWHIRAFDAEFLLL